MYSPFPVTTSHRHPSNYVHFLLRSSIPQASHPPRLQSDPPPPKASRKTLYGSRRFLDELGNALLGYVQRSVRVSRTSHEIALVFVWDV